MSQSHTASEPSLHEMQDLAGGHGIEFHGLHALNEAGVPLSLLKDAKAAGVNWWDIVCRLVADAPDIVTLIKKLIADAKAPAEANGNPDYQSPDPEKPLTKKEQKAADKAEEKAEDKAEKAAASHPHGHSHGHAH